MDNKHKFIEKGIATDASVHDSQALDDLLDEKDENQDLWADSAYTGEKQETTIKKYKVNYLLAELPHHLLLEYPRLLFQKYHLLVHQKVFFLELSFCS